MEKILIVLLLLTQIALSQNSGSLFRRANVIDGNNIISVFGNWGVIGQPANNGPRGAWKCGNNGYIGDFSILIGAKIPYSSTLNFATVTDCPVIRPSLGMDNSHSGVRQAFEPVNGYFNPSGNSPAISDDPSTWPANWSVWPYSQPASLETFFAMDDNADNEFNDPLENIWGIAFIPDSTDSSRNGMALKVEARYRQYKSGGLEDVMLLEYNIINEGTTIYQRLIFAGLLGTYVGITGTDDSPQEYDDDACFFDIENNYTFFWDWPMDNSRNPFWQGDPGYAAMTLVQSPCNPYDGIDNDRDNALVAGSSAPFFTAADFNGSIIQAGSQIVIIDNNYQRSLMTVPGNPFTITSCGKSFDIIPGVTFVREGNAGNSNAFDGIDNDFDGLIDENYSIHYNFNVQHLIEPLTINNAMGPTQYINYFTGQGLNDPLIDEVGIDLDEIGLTSFDYFAPATQIPMYDDEALYNLMSPGHFSLPSSYSNGLITQGDDGDYLFGSGVFTLEPGDTHKVVLGLVYANSPEELKSKVRVINNSNFNVNVNSNLQLLSPTAGVFSGNNLIISFQSQVSEGSIIIEYSENTGRSWNFVDLVSASSSNYNWDISDLPDGAFYQIRIRHSLQPTVVVTSDPFIINRPGQAIPQAYFTHNTGLCGLGVLDTMDISWVAGDADGDSITLSLFISTDQDTNWQFISNLPDSGTYYLNTRLFPNTRYALLRLEVWDGFANGEDITPNFWIQNTFPVLPDSLLQHTNGQGSGSIEVHIVDSLNITGHLYEVTFNDSATQKTYNVQNLTTGQYIITNCSQLNSSTMGPLFDGVRLLMDDLENAEINYNNTYWSNDSINLEFSFALQPLNLGSPWGIVYPINFPYDYQVEFHDQVVDTTEVTFRGFNIGLPPIETYFRIKNLTTNQYIKFIFMHQGSPAVTILPLDRLFMIEKDDNNIDQFSWPIIFRFTGTNLYNPGSGDTLFISTLKPFSSADQFQFSTDYLLSLVMNRKLVPNEFNLYQNYPNPFNPVCHIRFDIAKSSLVKLEIFNVLGQKVKTLVNKKMAADKYSVIWDAKNDFGNLVSSGIYIYRLKADNFVKSRKMIFVK